MDAKKIHGIILTNSPFQAMWQAREIGRKNILKILLTHQCSIAIVDALGFVGWEKDNYYDKSNPNFRVTWNLFIEIISTNEY